MSSNNDNKEKITEGQETFSDKVQDIDDVVPESEAIEDENENLIEIISGEIDYPEGKISLADAIKSTFDTDDAISEDNVIEDVDEEVVFVSPERIMNYVDDYLSHEEAFQNNEIADSESEETMYFSTDTYFDEQIESVDNSDEIISVNDDENIEERDIHGMLDKIFAEEAEKVAKGADESAEEDIFGFDMEKTEESFERDAEDLIQEKIVDESDENSNQDDIFGFDMENADKSFEKDAEDFIKESEVKESNEASGEDDMFGFDMEKSDKSFERDEADFIEGSEVKESDEISEDEDMFGFDMEKSDKTFEPEVEDFVDADVEETSEDIAVEKTEEDTTAQENSEVEIEDESDPDEVDLFELADIPAVSDEDIADEIFTDEATEEIESETEEDESEEELPAVFMQGRDALIINKESDEEDDLQASEDDADESAESNEIETDETSTDEAPSDDETTPSLTVHKHKDKDSESKKTSFLVAWAKKKTAAGWVKFSLKCVGVLLLVLCVAAVLYVNGLLDLIDYKAADDFEQFYNLSDTDYVSTSDEEYENPVYYNSSTTIEGFNESMIDIPKEDVINVLLIGTDVRGGDYEDRGNTDSMILLSINTRDKNIKLTSFMRDMYVKIPGRGKNRLNAAYAYGGPQLLFDTLKENFDVDVDLYARVNFYNFRKIIDKVGGIEMELTKAEARYMNKYAYKYKTDPVEPGLQTLDGAQALSYARCRKIDSDFNRTQRQRKVIVAFVDAIKGCSLTELNDMLNTMLPMVQTNMPKMQIVGLMVDALSYLNAEVETLNVPIKNSWQSAKINRMDVICPNFELNKTAIVAHIYSTYKLDVEDTVYQSFELPEEGRTKRTTRTTTTTTTSATESTTTSTTESSQTSTTTKKTYWWERTTTSTTTTTTTAAPTTTTTATTAAPTTSNQDTGQTAPAA